MNAPGNDASERMVAPTVIAVLLLIVTGCVATGSHGPVQSWWEDRGPVIPHKTFPMDCSACHEGDDWNTLKSEFSFDHEKETGVALVGAHQQAQCLRCHNDRGPVKVFAQRGCQGCHEDIHQGQLGVNCRDCHTQENWQPGGQIAMHASTRFPLIGAHAATACRRCHPGALVGNFVPTSAECVHCHQNDLARATSPDHMAQGWIDDCDRCHIPTSWRGAGFNHNSFPLTGGHAGVGCTTCHVNNQFNGISSSCSSCHLNDFNGTNSPNHVASGFSMNCEICHTINGWTGATFVHNSWPLTGAHSALACSQCHQNGIFSGTATNCVGCHQAQYNATTSPNHQSSGFSMNCETCHDTSSWNNATLNHSAFPLTGAHASASCNQCHQSGVFAGLPSNCVDCHLAQFNATTSPNHQSSGFGTNCQACHDTSNWNNANFNHSFPIAGPHNRPCASCHLNPNNFQQFSCTHCHEHRQSAMNSKHNNVNGYVWQSAACLNCHPNGHE